MTEEQIKARFIPFSSLQYSTEAFIDYCIPECAPKYNYALIGAGVSQNPKQPVSLREQHGFQVGGISMPADCWRSYQNKGNDDAVVLVMTAGDARKRITWADEIVVAAGKLGRAIDANGYVGPEYFIDRAQN